MTDDTVDLAQRYPWDHATARLRDVGEKSLIRDLIRPMLNPEGDADSIGDDCAVIPVSAGGFCASTDRVPADLVSFRLGILDYRGLGRYLAVLNLSDIAAMGGRPAGLLLNLGLPGDLRTADLEALLLGAGEACAEHGCRVVGGDLSSASELCLSATSLGVLAPARALRRGAARPGDRVYCSDVLGLTATAFAYFLRAKPAGLSLPEDSEAVLMDCFRKVRPRFDVSAALVASGGRASAMDNTDGAGQSYLELAEASGVAFILHTDTLPLHPLTGEVADLLDMDALDLALSAGADFQLLGAAAPLVFEVAAHVLTAVGTVAEGSGLYLQRPGVDPAPFTPQGWNYYSVVEDAYAAAEAHP